MNDESQASTGPHNQKGVQAKLKDETGKRYGRLTVLRREGKNISEQATWRCLCDCGNETVQAGITLRNGAVVSCGCYHAEISGTLNYKHGHSQKGIYRSYKEMVRRCTDPRHIGWKTYGGRGIKVCQRWLDDIENFITDMGPTWKKGLSIERRENDGNYEPGNCYWATMKQQNNNKSDNRIVEYNGKKQTLTQWADEVGMSCQALKARLDMGWTVHDALYKPLQRRKNRDKRSKQP